MAGNKRCNEILSLLRERYRHAKTELRYGSDYELLVAVILSAQCTDNRVNIITPEFFAAFPDALTLSLASEYEIFEKIKSCSYPNNKTKHLSAMGKMLMERFNGKVPDEPELLRQLPGVGRKTANVIASVAFGLPALAVDTHVFRVSARLGLTKGAKNPDQAEQQLLKLIPEEDLSKAHHWLIFHGRYVCKARKPMCSACFLNHLCSYYKGL